MQGTVDGPIPGVGRALAGRGGAGLMRGFALASLAIALSAILAALAFEHVGGFVPCALCLEQRVPYYVGIPLIALAAALAPVEARIARLLLAAGGVALAWSAGLGVYQAGAEWGFWQGPADCAGADAVARDAAQLLRQLSETRLVSCTEASGRFLGLSFAGWNVVAAGGAAGLALAGAATGPGRKREAAAP